MFCKFLTSIIFIFSIFISIHITSYAQIDEIDGIEIITYYPDLINSNINNSSLLSNLEYMPSYPIQSIVDEFGGAFVEDGIIFSAEEKVIGYSAENNIDLERIQSFDLFYIPFDGTNFGLKKRLGGDINTAAQEGPIHLFSDNKKMMFTQSYLDNDLKKYKLRIMEAHSEDGKKWEVVKQILPNFNGSIAHVAVSRSEETMVFSATLDNRYGKPNLFYTQKDEENNWMEPKAFSDKINTSGQEVFPTFYTNYDVIFSSDGHADTQGGLDFYTMNIKDIENPIVKHLQGEINSKKNDYHLKFSMDFTMGMFTSNRNKNGDDLFIFKVKENMSNEFIAVSELLILIKDLITESLVKNTHVTIKSKDGTILFNKELRNIDQFSFSLDLTIPEITLIITHPQYHTYEETIYVNSFLHIPRIYNVFLDKKNYNQTN